jgi:hypothetical protein
MVDWSNITNSNIGRLELCGIKVNPRLEVAPGNLIKNRGVLRIAGITPSNLFLTLIPPVPNPETLQYHLTRVMRLMLVVNILMTGKTGQVSHGKTGLGNNNEG